MIKLIKDFDKRREREKKKFATEKISNKKSNKMFKKN